MKMFNSCFYKYSLRFQRVNMEESHFQGWLRPMGVAISGVPWVWQSVESHGCGNQWSPMGVAISGAPWVWQSVESHGCDNQWSPMAVAISGAPWVWQSVESHECGNQWSPMGVAIIVSQASPPDPQHRMYYITVCW